VHCRHSNGDRCSIFVTECHRYRQAVEDRRSTWTSAVGQTGQGHAPSQAAGDNNPNGRGRRPRPAFVGGAEPGPPRRGNLTVPGGTVGSAAAAALLVGAVHPHPQLGAGTDRFRSPTSPATGRFIAVARTPRSTDSATRTGVDSRALAGHRPSDPASSGREGPFQMLPSRRRRRMVGGAWRE